MTRLLAVLMLSLAAGKAFDGTAEIQPSAREILNQVLSNRPLKDFSLKGRLFVNREDELPVEIFVRNSPNETCTIFQATNTHLLVVQPLQGNPRLYLRGTGELVGTQRMGRLLGSSFSYYDLAAPYLHWSNAVLVGEERIRAQNCFVINSTATGEPYARVKLWIHKEYSALLRAEAYDANDNLIRRFAITSFKKIGDVWVPRGMEMSFVPAGQALPSQEKSRLQIDEGDYDAHLPVDLFLPEKFGAR